MAGVIALTAGGCEGGGLGPDSGAGAKPATSPLLMVQGKVVVPRGEAGKLSVVRVGRPDPYRTLDSVPVVVRNRTQSTVYGIEVTAIAKTRDGSFEWSGSSKGLTPYTVGPGEWAFGDVDFGADVPDDATIEAEAVGSTERGFTPKLDLKAVEATIVTSQVGQQIVGVVENGNAETVAGPVSVDTVCFSSAGTAITGTHQTFLDVREIPPGDTASFTIDLLFAEECPNFAVGSTGWDM